MKTYESSVLRPFASLIRGILTMSLMLGAYLAFIMLAQHVMPDAPKSGHVLHALESGLFLVPGAIVLLFGVPITWSNFKQARGRYRLHGTELEIRSGWLGRELQTVRLADIQSITLSTGPLMRLLGRDDLILTGGAFTRLYGVKDGEALRTLLLERRDSLLELKAEEDAARDRDSRDAVLARLAAVLERLEAKS